MGWKTPCIFGILVAVMSSLVACSYRRAEPTTFPELPSAAPSAMATKLPQAPLSAPLPKPGRASISGTLYSYTIRRIVPKTMFYLTSAVGEDNRKFPPILIGPDDEAGDIRGASDATGQFAMDDLPPGNYFLIVWAPYTWIPAETDEFQLEPRLIELKANKPNPLGVVYLSWP